MNSIFHLGIVVASLIILYFAYFTKNELAKLIVFVLLGAILIGELLGILAGIQFLDFLGDIFNLLKTLVFFVEIAIIIFLMFFKYKIKNNSILKITIIVLLVLLVIVEANIF
jgi:hypothetical protein